MTTLFSIPASYRNIIIALMAGAHVSSTPKNATDGVYAYRKDGEDLFHDRDRKDEPLAGYLSFNSGKGADRYRSGTYIINKDLSDLIPECKRINDIGSLTVRGLEFSMTGENTIKCGCQTIDQKQIRAAVLAVKKWLKAAGTGSAVVTVDGKTVYQIAITPETALRIGKIAALAGANVSRTLDEFRSGCGVKLVGDIYRYCRNYWKDTEPLVTYLNPNRIRENDSKFLFLSKDVSEVLDGVGVVKKQTGEVDLVINASYRVKSEGDLLVINGTRVPKDDVKKIVSYMEKFLKAVK